MSSLVWFGFSAFWVTPNYAQGFLLAPHSGTTPGGAREYGMPGLEPGSALCEASSLPAALSLPAHLLTLILSGVTLHLLALHLLVGGVLERPVVTVLWLFPHQCRDRQLCLVLNFTLSVFFPHACRATPPPLPIAGAGGAREAMWLWARPQSSDIVPANALSGVEVSFCA